MDETVDGEFQNFKSKGGSYTRANFFGKHPDLLEKVSNLTDEEIESLNRGGHDPVKVYNAYRQAYIEDQRPTVILAFTIKGYGIGSKQADNATHQVKNLTKDNLNEFIDYFKIPRNDIDLDAPDFIDLEDKKELKEYLLEQRKLLDGFLPKRSPS